MKVKYSALVSDMRGKLNGSVASKNRYGGYLRNKVTPSNPKSIHQVEQRAKLAQFSQGWRGLTEQQREAWNSAVSNWQKTNIFGDIVTPSGNTLYTRLNVNIANVGGSPVSLPPLPMGVEAPEGISAVITVGTSEMDVSVLPATVPAGHKLVVQATEPLSPGISNANNKFRVIKYGATLTSGDYDAWNDYTGRFGTPTIGMKVFFKIHFVRETTGEISQELKTSVIVA